MHERGAQRHYPSSSLEPSATIICGNASSTTLPPWLCATSLKTNEIIPQGRRGARARDPTVLAGALENLTVLDAVRPAPGWRAALLQRCIELRNEAVARRASSNG